MQKEGPTAYVSLKSSARAREIADFNRKRRHNALRLKNRFTDIIERYGHDFEDVGDVIDLETGQVVVDNGHLRDMVGELDPAHDVYTSGEDEEGEGGFVANEEEIDELGVDMLTEGEIMELRGLVPETEEEEGEAIDRGDLTQSVEQEECMDTALVSLPAAELSLIGEQQKFEAPMFPQLEMAVNSMTSMLQQQMLAMLGQVLPAQGAAQPLPKSRQILQAPAPQNSLKRRFDDLTPSNRIHTEPPEPRISSPKSHALKRRRISDAQEQKETRSKIACGRSVHSYPMHRRRVETPQAEAQEALAQKTPKSMPARSKRSMRMRSPNVKTGMRTEIESSPARSISMISQVVLDDDTSEDELNLFVSPGRMKASTSRASSPNTGISKASSLGAKASKAASTKSSTPRIISPQTTTPKASSPKDSTPKPSTPKAHTPQASPPRDLDPRAPLPEADTPIINAQRFSSQATSASETTIPKVTSPEASAPATSSPKMIALKASPSKLDTTSLPPATRPRQPSPRVVILMRPVATSEIEETKEDSVPSRAVKSPKLQHKRWRKSRLLVSEQHKEIDSFSPTTFDETQDKPSGEPPQPLVADEDIFADDEEGRLDGAAADAAPSFESKKASKRRRRTILSRLLAEAEQYTSIWHSTEDGATSHRRREVRLRKDSPIATMSETVVTTREAKSRISFGDAKRSSRQRIGADDHAIKSEDKSEESGGFSLGNVTDDGLVTIVDMTMLNDDTPAPREANPTLQKPYTLRTRAASLGRRSTRAAGFASGAEIIPDSEEEEGDDVVESEAVKVEDEVEKIGWKEDPNSQFVWD